MALPREVKGLSAVSLFNDFASEMVYPVLPAFITRTLGGSALALGALDGAADLTASLLRWVSGHLADRRGWTRPLIFVGYAAAVAVRPVISLATAAWQVIGFRVIDRIGKGMRSPPRDALIASVTEPAERGRAFGFNRAADHLGAVLGSLAAWALLRQQADARRVIAWSVIPGLIAVLVLAVVLRTARAGREGATPSPARPTAAAERDRTGSAFWAPVVVLVLLTVARLPETLLLLRLQDLGVALPIIPLVWAALHVVRSSASYPGGWLADRLGPRGALALGGLLYSGVALGLSRPLGGLLAMGVFVLYGGVAGLSEPAERLVVARLAPVHTGRGFGSYQGLAGLAALPAGLGFGALYRGVGGSGALLASAAAMVLGSLGWLVLTRGDAIGRGSRSRV